MNNSIQESEMYLASQFCKRISNAFTNILVMQTKIYEGEITNCNNKIQHEQKEISFLKEQIALCNQLLIQNRERIRQIPSEIKNLEEDNKNCKENIRRTEIPVYSEYYDSYYERWYTEIDEAATYENRMYVSRLEDRIEDNQKTIRFLTSEKSRCENNVSSLLTMITSINTCIGKKEELINKIKENITRLQSKFSDFKKENGSCQTEIKKLNDKIVKGAEFIHSFGSTLAKVKYKESSLSYNPKDIFTVTSESLNEEIQALTMFTTSNVASLSAFAKDIISLSSQLDDEITRQAKTISTEGAKKIQIINDDYQNNITIIKKAASFLAEYEKIRI